MKNNDFTVYVYKDHAMLLRWAWHKSYQKHEKSKSGMCTY